MYFFKHNLCSLLFIISLLIFTLNSCNKGDGKTDTGIGKPPDPADTTIQTYYRGVDLSFQPQIEEYQTSYFNEDSLSIDLLPFLASKGVNLVRLRLWHTPQNIHSGLEEVLDYSLRIKQAGINIHLDIHYSDTWADPGHQIIPQAWENLNFDQINDSIYQYTHDVLKLLRDQNTLPAIVQIGNETNSGFLWDYGKVGGNFDDNWPNYTTLVKSAIKAVHDIGENNDIDIMIHFAGFQGNEWFFDNLEQYNVDFDIIGLSYYSRWHGTDFDEVEDKIISFSQQFSKKIMIVETGYPWTLGWNDWTNNNWGDESQLITEFPATPEGQKSMMEALDMVIKSIDNDRGIGFCYWAPDWVAYKGPEATDGSVWENVAIFDFDHKILPVISVFSED